MTFQAYIDHGWKLCAIPAGTKGPTAKGWNTKPLADAEGVASAGLLHALSGTCALDIDNMEAARPWLAERGVDVDALLDAEDAVQITSGRPGRAKLLYRMKRPLRTFKPKGSGIELRCATAGGKSVQDVLPPSIHPDTGKPYEWAGGLLSDWRNPPPIPPALLSLWRELDTDESEPVETPAAEQPKPVNLVKLRKAAFLHSPDCEYDEWIKVGMQLHNGTGGMQEGLDIWCEWSRGIKRKPYPGDVTLKSHYLSFGSEPGKHVATGEALAAELPAEAEDFEIIPEDKQVAKQSAIAYLLDRFVFVACQELYFDRHRGVPIGDKAIRHMFTHTMPNNNGRLLDPVDQLMRNGKKTIVEALAFHPGEGVIFTYAGNQYGNTFTGNFPKPLEPMKDELDKIEWIFNRIEDPEFREWLRQFYAHIVQRPGTKIRSAPLILSKTEGNGKSMTAHLIPKLLVGPAHYAEVDQGALSSDFNDYLVGQWVVALTEFRAGTRADREAISKKAERWVADDMLQINPKGHPGYTVPNHLVVTASSNKGDAVQIDEHNRKWAVHWLNAPPMTEAEKDWVFEGFLKGDRGAGVLRHYFLNVPITTFSPNADAIRTADRERMIRASTMLDHELLVTALEQCSAPLDKNAVLTSEVADYVRRNCIAKPSNHRIGGILADPPFNATPRLWSIGKQQYRGWVLRGDTRWLSASSKEVMAYIKSEDTDIDITS